LFYELGIILSNIPGDVTMRFRVTPTTDPRLTGLSTDAFLENFPFTKSADDSLRLVLTPVLLIVESRLDHGNDL